MMDIEKVDTEGSEASSDGLSLRDALEVAVEANKDAASAITDIADETDVTEAPSATPEEPTIEPPAEYTTEEKDDFRQLSRKGQEAQLRLHRSRLSTVEQIKRDKQTLAEERRAVEAEKKLAETMRPFVKAMGGKYSTEVALQKALQMWHDFEESDPREAAAVYLQAKGVPVPKDLIIEDGGSQSRQPDPQIQNLQQRVDALTQERAREHQAREAVALQQTWNDFSALKNSAGQARFPDAADNSETGLKLGARIGSLVGGKTELSRQFIASCQERIPGLTSHRLLEEAYRFAGGRVDDSEAPKSQQKQSTPEHLARSRRAASSVPGGGARGGSQNGAVRKFKSLREALEAAVEQHSD